MLVRHGGMYVRVHTCRLVKTPEYRNERLVDDSVVTVGDIGEKYSTDSEDEEISVDESSSNLSRIENNGSISNAITTESEVVGAGSSEVSDPIPNQSTNNCVKTRSKINVKIGQRIQGVDSNTGEFISGKIVSRAGKATGKYKNCYNLTNDTDGSTDWINLNDLDDVSTLSDDSDRVILFNTAEVENAKEVEMKNWHDNNVYDEVEDVGQSAVSVRWVITEKVKNNRTIVKARLVARGFEEETSMLRKDSPTCSKEGIRLAISLAATKQWSINAVDVKAAFLQGDKISREIYLLPPPEYFNGKLWRLNKTVYGLCDAARAWYTRVRDELLNMSVKMCSHDPSLFYSYCNGELSGIICVYVDDFLWAGTKQFEKSVIVKMHKLFLIGSSTSDTFKYVGLNLLTTTQGITVDQYKYASTLSPIKISHQRSALKNSLLSDREKTNFRCLLGQLNWLSTQTRPDLAFESCALSGVCSKATVADMLRLNKLVLRASTHPLKIQFPKMSSTHSCVLECFSDASFANLPDGGSQGGFIVFLLDDTGSRCPIFWQSRKVRRVVKSTLAAETLALLDSAEAGVYIASIIREISRCNLDVICKVDNKSLVDALSSSKCIEDRRLRIDMAVISDMLTRKELKSVSWVPTTQQHADCLTKRGASTEQLRAVLSGSN